MPLKITLKSSYKKLNATSGMRETIWVWNVTSASPKDIDRYCEEQGDRLVRDTENNNTPLFFNKNFPGVRQTELERVVLADGTVLYRVNMLEKTLQVEGLKVAEIAKLEAYLEVYGTSTARPIPAPKAAAPIAEPAPEVVETTEPGGETLNSGI